MRAKKQVLRRAVPATLPVLAGYLFLGIAYGIAMKARGFGTLLSGAISVLVYGGSLQFAMLEPLCASFAPVTFAFLCLLIQARHLFYGLTMLVPYSQCRRVRPYLIFALSDETYSLVCQGAPKDLEAEDWYLAVSALDQSYWVMGTLFGALLGTLFPVDLLQGIDFSMTALFLVIVTDQTTDMWRQYRQGKVRLSDVLFAPLLGGLGTLLCLLLAGRESFLLFSMAMIFAGFALRYRTDPQAKGGCAA